MFALVGVDARFKALGVVGLYLVHVRDPERALGDVVLEATFHFEVVMGVRELPHLEFDDLPVGRKNPGLLLKCVEKVDLVSALGSQGYALGRGLLWGLCHDLR